LWRRRCHNRHLADVFGLFFFKKEALSSFPLPPRIKHFSRARHRAISAALSDATRQPRSLLAMNKDDIDLLDKTKPKVERPRLYKVMLVNDDFTPRGFVVQVLQAEFRMNESQAQQVMMTAHRQGVCVVAVFVQDIAETKATRATDAARRKGYPLLFTTEPEE
jgi:ATP-dependent Clp protease adaptor protein ClpS